jgi:hypothetical protein
MDADFTARKVRIKVTKVEKINKTNIHPIHHAKPQPNAHNFTCSGGRFLHRKENK